MSQKTPDEPRSIKAIQTTGKIINALESQNGAGVTELANLLNVSKGTIHTHLNTLRRDGFVTKDEQTYYLSLQFLKLGESARQRYDFSDILSREVEELANDLDVRAQVLVSEGGKGVCLYVSSGPNAMKQSLTTGEFDHLHYTAAGKAILAHLPEERVSDILDQHGLPAPTENTITDRDKLFEDLEKTRQRGYSVNREEKIPGLVGIGVPFRNKDGCVLASISVAVPSSEVTGTNRETEIANRVRQCKNKAEVNLRLSSRR
ncbi:IclR family transcriptional regulator [Natrinema halophilum]|uniref:IclR family transcriptional regulator n=1 Tax=Natrinema halophilum TaxID=1699371 RepID=UPI001F2E03F9|nr:IclR family transcriptional regulator [Natrinema halophilum]UHQ96320.1 IclR family transcriptional regulator [Natrinema halophilum]